MDKLTPFELKTLQATTTKPQPPSKIGEKVWWLQGHKTQGLARMAGKFLSRLQKKGLVKWVESANGNYYWGLTEKGIKFLKEANDDGC